MEIEYQMRLDWLKDNVVGTCMHCGKKGLRQEEGTVCDTCYNQYTPGMLADLEG